MSASFPLYGYLFSDSARVAYIVDPETSWVVVNIFEQVASGVPLKRLCRDLEARGIPTPGQVLLSRGQLPTGKPASSVWRKGTLLRFLHHPAYWGEHSAYRWRSTVEKVRPVETGVTHKRRIKQERDSDDPARIRLPASACPALVSPELAARAHARLAITKAESAGRNPDPLATIWRGMARCGHCGGPLHTHKNERGDAYPRKYTCGAESADPLTGKRRMCPGGWFTVSASVVDPAGWADVRAWLSDPDNVARLFADWEQKRETTGASLSSRLDAVNATIADLRAKMGALAESIAETAKGESRRTLQEKLDRYADQVPAEEKKREKLLREAREAADYTQAQADFTDWVHIVSQRSAAFTREKQRDTLRALGAEITLWRDGYVHPDGWPQRYKIVLHFTGFTNSAEPVTLPAKQPALLAADAVRLPIVTPPS